MLVYGRDLTVGLPGGRVGLVLFRRLLKTDDEGLALVQVLDGGQVGGRADRGHGQELERELRLPKSSLSIKLSFTPEYHVPRP